MAIEECVILKTMDDFKFIFLLQGQLESLSQIVKFYLTVLNMLLCYEVFLGTLFFPWLLERLAGTIFIIYWLEYIPGVHTKHVSLMHINWVNIIMPDLQSLTKKSCAVRKNNLGTYIKYTLQLASKLTNLLIWSYWTQYSHILMRTGSTSHH